MISRRGFLGTAAVLASATAVGGRVQAASIPEAPSTKATTMQPPIFRRSAAATDQIPTIVSPPFGLSTCPVMKFDSPEARNSTAYDISSGSA